MSNSYFAPQRRAGNRFLAWKTSTDPPHSRRWRVRPLLYWMAALFVVAASTTAASQTETQHGSKLVGTGTQGPSEQGWSVALSADGHTAIVGGIVDNKLTGAAWVFKRSSDTWSQQGNKLVGTGVIGQAGQGVSVALSADGKTAMVVDRMTTRALGRHGSLNAAAMPGANKVASWSATVRMERPHRALLLRCPPTAIPPSWAGLTMTRRPGRRGFLLGTGMLGPNKANWSAPGR
jgi:hypothetical protein